MADVKFYTKNNSGQVAGFLFDDEIESDVDKMAHFKKLARSEDLEYAGLKDPRDNDEDNVVKRGPGRPPKSE